MKLQDAYAAESNQLGTWALIGYTAPGTKNSDGTFESTVYKYSGAMTGAVALAETGATAQAKAWLAVAQVALNDCKKDSEWRIAVTGATTGVTYENTYSDQANCEALTPNFKNIGTKASTSNTTGGNG